MPAPGKYALLIGNSDFSDERLSRLLTPTEDVSALREALLHPEIGGFEADDIVEVLDHSLEPVQQAVHWLFNSRSPDDLVILYYSGHGLLTRNNRLYLALAGSSNDTITTGSLPARELKDAMDDSRSRKQIIILDCCHSGAFVEGVKAGTTKAVNKGTFDPEGHGRYILTASDAMQFAWDGQRLVDGDDSAAKKTSPFTHFLVQGLMTGEAAPESETISVDQLYTYVHKKVVEADGIDMTPQRFVDKGAGELVVARNPHALVRIEEDLLTNLVSDNHHARIGAVHELGRLIGGKDPSLAVAARQELESRHTTGEYDVRVLNAIKNILNPRQVNSVDSDLTKVEPYTAEVVEKKPTSRLEQAKTLAGISLEEMREPAKAVVERRTQDAERMAKAKRRYHEAEQQAKTEPRRDEEESQLKRKEALQEAAERQQEAAKSQQKSEQASRDAVSERRHNIEARRHRNFFIYTLIIYSSILMIYFIIS